MNLLGKDGVLVISAGWHQGVKQKLTAILSEGRVESGDVA